LHPAVGMNDFLQRIADDVRHGRESWRVLTVGSLVSFVIAVVVTVAT
jgi:hypothetical protein